VAVVAASWAQQSFGRPADALHREILVNRVPVTIVGVLPSAFRDVAVGEATDIWLPASLQLRLRMHGNSRTASGDDRENHADWNQEERVSWLRVMFRSKDDDREAMASLRQAWEPERESVAQTLTNPDERQHLRRTAWESVPSPSGQSRFRDEFRATGQLLVGVVTVMLILVCANVSGLLMVRSMSRHREIGVRLALGASGWRVARLAVMEALLLSLIGGGVAWLASSWLLPLAVRMLAPGMDLEAELGTRTVLFMLGLSVCCALASALGPAVWISRTRPLTAISGNLGLGQAPVRFSRILVVAQFTVAVFLVAAATHLGNVLRQTLQADHGFDRTQVLTAQFDVETAGYTRSEVPGVLTRLQDTLLAVPGVERVSFSSSGILAGSHSSSGVFTREGRAKGMLEYVQHDAIVPGYLRTVGLTLRSGRDFSDSDGETAPPVALISANLAQRWFGTDQVAGKIFGFGSEPSSEDWTIVGVVANNRPNGVREQSAEIFYVPVKQWKHEYPRFLAIRFSGAESPVRAGVSVALTRVEPGLVFSGWKTLDDRVKDDLGRVYATTQLAGIFGGCALVLAGTGIAGALSYLVVLRQKDLALRMAVGSEPDHVLRLVLGDALHLGLVGSALGGAAVVLLPLIPFFESVFSGRPGLIPAVLAAGTAVLTALIAGYIPARRAARVDPLVLLKSD